jgi:FAD:protein FMN transferase
MRRRDGRALASPLQLTVSSGAGEHTVDRAWAAIEAEFAAVDAAMSRFRADSEITRLHRRGPGAGGVVSDRLRSALALADRATRLTRGRFDARILVDLERLGSIGVPQVWPGAERSVDARAYRFDRCDRTVRLAAPVDLGGVGKGLALRWAARRAAVIVGDTGFLIDAGGDIATRGSADGEPWSIAIEDPTGAPEPVAVCVLPTDSAVATSSIRRASWRDPDGKAVHHLIDPRTGSPGGDGLRAVTVAGPDPAWAEIWSKALFLEGSLQIGATARARGLAAWWVDVDGDLSMTPAARERTTWVRAEAGAS